MGLANALGGFQVGDGARQTQATMPGAGRQAQTLAGLAHQQAATGIEWATLFERASRQISGGAAIAALLAGAGGRHSLGHPGA